MVSRDFTAKLHRLKNLYRKFPEGAGIEAENFSNERFVRKNWVDKTVTPWKKPEHVPDWVPRK